MILVTGATGNVGSEAARLLAARHQPTRALGLVGAATPLEYDVLLGVHIVPPGERDEPLTWTLTCSHQRNPASVLLITHEPEGLDQVDEIVVLDHGRVAERVSTTSYGLRAGTTSR